MLICGPKVSSFILCALSAYQRSPLLSFLSTFISPFNRYKLEGLSNAALLQLLYQCYDLRVFSINSLIFMQNKTWRNVGVNIKKCNWAISFSSLKCDDGRKSEENDFVKGVMNETASFGQILLKHFIFRETAHLNF